MIAATEIIIRTDHHLVTLNEDGTVTERRAGEAGRTYASLQEYYMSLNSPTARWAAHCQTILAAGGTILDTLAQIKRLVPLVAPEIDATEPGQIVPGTPWTREQCEALLVLAVTVEAFTEAQIGDTGTTPQQEISRYA
jgi:hypothetical protein